MEGLLSTGRTPSSFCLSVSQLYKLCFTTALCSKFCALSPLSPPVQVEKALGLEYTENPKIPYIQNAKKNKIFNLN